MYNASFTFFLYQSVLWSKHIVRLTPLDPVACTQDVCCSSIAQAGFQYSFLMFNNFDLCCFPVSNLHRVTLTRNTVHHTFLFFWGCWGIDVSEEASQG